MEEFDPRVTAYIDNSRDFAKPILEHLRMLVHQAFPAIKETIKWGFPHFEHKGTVCSMAAFKEHCAFSFWKAKLLQDPHQLLEVADRAAMGHFGKISSVNELP